MLSEHAYLCVQGSKSSHCPSKGFPSRQMNTLIAQLLLV